MSDFDYTIRDERDRLRMYVGRLEQENERLERKVVLLAIQVDDLQRQVSEALKRCAQCETPYSA